MSHRWRQCLMLGLAAAAVLVARVPASAQTPSAPAAAGESAATSESEPAEKLAASQRQIAEKYRHLEDVLLRMAELSAATDPHRAALLKKAVEQSKDRSVGVQLEQLVELLDKDQLSRALENQTQVDRDLRSLLDLLLSENRAKRVESQKARLREFLKRISGLIQQQKDIQARTAADDPTRLAAEQLKVSDKTGELAQEVEKNDQQAADAGEEAAKDAKQGSDEKSEGQEGEKQDGGESTQPEQSQQQPTHQRLDTARRHMQDAEQKLKEAQRDGAVEKQEEALRELQAAKAKLEAILRQLREEEIERVLAMLEARFRRMLDAQQEVYEGTVRLDKTPPAERTHGHEIEASRLSGRQSQLVVEMDKALLLLRDDGSAAAFLEAAEQIRDDMQQVVDRLAQAKVGPMTQNLEEDIVAALKEMVESLQKAQKDQAKKPGRAAQTSEPQEPPLVDVLAEIKMIRALQMRVNSRTARYSQMIEGEQADSVELLGALKQLAERQQRIHRITRDLQTGKGQ